MCCRHGGPGPALGAGCAGQCGDDGSQLDTRIRPHRRMVPAAALTQEAVWISWVMELSPQLQPGASAKTWLPPQEIISLISFSTGSTVQDGNGRSVSVFLCLLLPQNRRNLVVKDTDPYGHWASGVKHSNGFRQKKICIDLQLLWNQTKSNKTFGAGRNIKYYYNSHTLAFLCSSNIQIRCFQKRPRLKQSMTIKSE